MRGCTYGHDHDMLSPLWQLRSENPDGWPLRFLFIGRYVEDKGVHDLLAAYADYRNSVAEPWPLSCCGIGPLAAEIEAAPGADNHGFVQPDAIGEVMLICGALIVPSRREPWGMVIEEASAAGLPVIATDVCGAAQDLLQSGQSGIVVPPANPAAITEAMLWMHNNHEALAEMGQRSVAIAAPYSAANWADRIVSALAHPAETSAD